MKKSGLFILALFALAACGKEVPVTVSHELEIEFPDDCKYSRDSVCFINLSEENSVDISALGAFIDSSRPTVLAIHAAVADSMNIVGSSLFDSYPDVVCGGSDGTRFSLLAGKSGRIGRHSDACSCLCVALGDYSLVVGRYDASVIMQSADYENRIFLLDSDTDPSSEFSRKSFCDCIASQWGFPVPTSVTFHRDYVFARPAQWSLFGPLKIEDNGLWCHFPVSFTIKKEL